MEIKLKASEHFCKLPLDLKRRAIRNMRRNYRFKTLPEALKGSFHWASTPEGTRYWKNKYNYYKALEAKRPAAPYSSRLTVNKWITLFFIIFAAVMLGLHYLDIFLR